MKKSILKWLENLDKGGNELSIGWEGGGDSGWCFFNIDGSQEDNEYTEAILEYMYDTLDYGSWAGEFSANGTAIYDHKTKTFEGTDHYGEDGNDVLECNVIIKVPKELWFETLHVETESYYDEAPNVSVQFIVKNGFLTQEHLNFCSNLEAELKDEFEAMFDNYESTDDHEFRGCTDSWIIDRKDAIEETDGMLVFNNINKIDVQTIERQDKSVVLELDDDIIKAIDEKLNQTEDAN